jgi:hypothetical protein
VLFTYEGRASDGITEILDFVQRPDIVKEHVSETESVFRCQVKDFGRRLLN